MKTVLDIANSESKCKRIKSFNIKRIRRMEMIRANNLDARQSLGSSKGNTRWFSETLVCRPSV